MHDKIVQRLAAEDGEPDLNLIPAHNVLDAIVMFAQTGNVDTVFIAGKKVKEDGRLLRPDSDLSTKKNQLIETGRRLIREGGVSDRTTSCVPRGQIKPCGEGLVSVY